MSISVILFLIAVIAGAVETFQSRSFGWGAVTFIAGGLLASSW
jgi:hypothetical protein